MGLGLDSGHLRDRLHLYWYVPGQGMGKRIVGQVGHLCSCPKAWQDSFILRLDLTAYKKHMSKLTSCVSALCVM